MLAERRREVGSDGPLSGQHQPPSAAVVADGITLRFGRYSAGLVQI